MYYLTVWRPRSKINVVGLKIKVSAEVYSFWRLQGKICFLAFSSFQSLSAFLSFHPLPYGSPISPSIVLCPTPTLSFVPPYKNLCYYIKSTWIIQASLPSSKYLIQNFNGKVVPSSIGKLKTLADCFLPLGKDARHRGNEVQNLSQTNFILFGNFILAFKSQ